MIRVIYVIKLKHRSMKDDSLPEKVGFNIHQLNNFHYKSKRDINTPYNMLITAFICFERILMSALSKALFPHILRNNEKMS